MIYRVLLSSSYRDFYFDFVSMENASAFIFSAATTYNKQASDPLVVCLEAYTMDEYNMMNKKEEEQEAE